MAPSFSRQDVNRPSAALTLSRIRYLRSIGADPSEKIKNELFRYGSSRQRAGQR